MLQVYDLWAGLWARATPNGIMSTMIAPPRSTYNPQRDMPDLAGKVALVTGGTAGIGRAVVQQLLLKNAKVYITARNPTKAAMVIKQLEKETGKMARALELDFEDLTTVKSCATAFLAQEDKLDLLFCNAGLMVMAAEELTKQGHDKQFGVHVIGHYLLELLLLPALRASAVAHGARSRVVHTSSKAHTSAPGQGIVFASLKGGPERDAVLAEWGATSATWKLYAQSKLGNNLVANVLDRAHGHEVVHCSVHPAWTDSDLFRDNPSLRKVLSLLFLWPAETAAHTLLYAATVEEGDGFGGKYLNPFARMGRADGRADSVELQDELQAWLDREIREYL